MSDRRKLLLHLVADDLKRGHTTIIMAKGNSMYPLIRNDIDRIVVAPIYHPPRIGDVVFAQMNNGEFLLHRVFKVFDNELLLRGDGNAYGIERVALTSTIGEAVAIIKPHIGRIKKGSFGWWCFEHLWVKSRIGRRVALGLLRKLRIY